MEPDLTQYQYHPACELDGCGKPADYIAKGCMDKQPALLCADCLALGLRRLTSFLHMWERVNKRIMVCGDCYRPILTLETHLTVKEIK